MIPKFAIIFMFLEIVITGSHATPASGLDRTDNVEVEQNDKELVKIQLYYETYCGDCILFDSTIFKDTVLELQSYVDVHLYPFGNGHILENGTITCQNGESECYGNKLHACAIDQIKNVTLAVVFTSCLMNDPAMSGDKSVERCGKRMDIDSEPIMQCAKGQKGEELLRYYGEESKKINYQFVPYLLINGAYPVNDDEDYTHFKEDVCKEIKNPPKQCTQ